MNLPMTKYCDKCGKPVYMAGLTSASTNNATSVLMCTCHFANVQIDCSSLKNFKVINTSGTQSL